VAAIGALMESRTIATNKLYTYACQFAGDTAQTLQNGAANDAYGRLQNGTLAPLKVAVTRDPEGRVATYAVVNADGTPTAPPTKFTIDANAGTIKDTTQANLLVGYVELHTIEGGALSQVQQDINQASAVISTFSNLIAANKQALKSVLNVIR